MKNLYNISTVIITEPRRKIPKDGKISQARVLVEQLNIFWIQYTTHQNTNSLQNIKTLKFTERHKQLKIFKTILKKKTREEVSQFLTSKYSTKPEKKEQHGTGTK